MMTMALLRRPTSERTTLSEPAGGLTAAMLDLRLGAAHLDLRGTALGDGLLDYTAHRPVLAVDRIGRRVSARQARSWIDAPHPPDIDLALSERLEWSLDVRAAGMSGWLDLRRLRLGALQLRALGASARADLPAPAGPVHVRLDGRGLTATVSVPAGAMVRVWSQDGWEVLGAADGRPLAEDRYDVWLEGRGRCRVERRRDERAATPALRVLRPGR
jgi:hypothetical protein